MVRVTGLTPRSLFGGAYSARFTAGISYRLSAGGKLQAINKNMLSALEHPQVVENYLQEECRMGRVLGPFDPEELPGLHISKFGVIPKSNQPGKLW